MVQKKTVDQAIIIAAGESSRFWPLNHYHKSQIKILGHSLTYWTIKSLAEQGIKNIVVVIRPPFFRQAELKKDIAKLAINLSFAIQEKPSGTGQAIWQAKDLIKKEPFFIFWPYKVQAGEIAQKILEKYQTADCQAILVGGKVATPGDYGFIKYVGDEVIEICEKPKPGEEPSDIRVMGCYFFEPDFFDYYQKVKGTRPEDFVDALNLYCRAKKMRFVLWDRFSPRLKYPWEILDFLKLMLTSPEFKNYIAPSAKIGQNVSISGPVYIGEQTIIGDQTTIEGPCYLGNKCRLGAHNVLRGPVNLEDEVITGAFMELKNCLVQKGTHFHSGFLGDSIVGEQCRFGAGFISANRRFDRQEIKTIVKGKEVNTGLTYLGAIIGNQTRFGVHSGTMPGVLIGSDCLIGPNVMVFKNLSDGLTWLD
ncbi:MAG: sugar phosphate nucleotidyltransferase [Minisyncoccales bacterium]